MLLDIKPQEHNQMYNCLEDLLSVLCGWKGHGCEMIFARSWGFGFYPDASGRQGILGNRIDDGGYTIWECLYRYYGIKSTFNLRGVADEQTTLINNELDAGQPVILLIDSYWVPWNKTYKKFHRQHFCLAVGIDEEDGCVICLDTFWNSDLNRLTQKNFSRGNAICITFGFLENVPAVDWKETLKDAVGQARSLDGAKNSFEAMRAFADEMLRSMDLGQEIKGCEELVWVAPLFMQLGQIASTRMQFAMVLNCLAGRHGVPALGQAANDMEEAGRLWRFNVFMPLLRLASKQENGSEQEDGKSKERRAIERIADQILHIADFEEKIAVRLSEMLL